MSGYGMPQESAPRSTRSGRSGPALPVLELVGVGLAVLAFIVAFLPWAKPDVQVPDGVDASVDSVNGWNLALPTVATTLLLVAAALVAAPLLSRPAATGTEDDPAASPVPALLATLGALFMVVWVITGGTYLGTDLSRGLGTWLGLVLGLGTAAVLVLSWLQRTGRVKKAPAAGPSNWNQGQPQGWGQPGGGYQSPQGYGASAERPAQRPAQRPADGPAAAARVRAAAVVRGARRLPRADHRRAAGPAAGPVRAGAVPAAGRWLPEPGRRRVQPPGLTLGAPAQVTGPAMSEWVAVTDVRQRPGARPPAEPPAVRPSLVLHGCLVAAAAALSGLATLAAVVLIAWVADAGPGSTGTDAVRAAADGWLLAHGGGLTVPAGHVRGIPLGLTVLAAVVLHRAGASLARAVEVPDLRTAGRTVAALAVPYGLLAAVVAKLAATGTAAASAPLAGLGALVLAGLAGGRGVLRAADLGPAAARRVPPWLPAVGRATLAGAGALAAAGLAVLLAALVRHGGRFAELFGSLRPGLVGGVVLLLGCVLLLPNGALWALAYAAGPGFTVGAGTGISPFGATLGPVPAFPLLAALPGDGTPPPVVRAALLLPVLAGVLAGCVVGRRMPPATGPGRLPAALTGRAARLATYGLLAGVLAALLIAALAVLAGGALGPGYLAAVGPSGWQVAAALALEVGVPAAVTAALVPTPGGARPTPPDGGDEPVNETPTAAAEPDAGLDDDREDRDDRDDDRDDRNGDRNGEGTGEQPADR